MVPSDALDGAAVGAAGAAGFDVEWSLMTVLAGCPASSLDPAAFPA